MKNPFKIYLLLFLFPCLIFSQTGKVVAVKDGDTVVVLDEHNVQHTVRVADIDCPEKNQPYGKKAKCFTSDQIFGKIVSIKIKNSKRPKDRYGRIIGSIIYNKNKKNLSEELLKNGLAWHYKHYSKSIILSQLESKAKKGKLGLWSEVNPINPYNWRKGQRN